MNLKELVEKRIKEFNESWEKDEMQKTFEKHPTLTKFAFWYIDKFLTRK